jgi:hypothetical protein
MADTIEIFISYAEEDREYLKELENQLKSLARSIPIDIWHRRKVIPGQEVSREVDTHLKAARIILLLLSPNYLASEYLRNEMTQAMKRHETEEVRVIPVLLRPIYWQDTPLKDLEPLPTNRQPVSRWPDKSDAFDNIDRGIRKAVKELTPPARTDTPSATAAAAKSPPEKRQQPEAMAVEDYEGASRAATSGPPEPERHVTRYGRLQFPAQVPLYTPTALVITINREQLPGVSNQVRLELKERKWPLKVIATLISVQPEDFLIQGASYGIIDVPEMADSAPLTFMLIPQSMGKKDINILFEQVGDRQPDYIVTTCLHTEVIPSLREASVGNAEVRHAPKFSGPSDPPRCHHLYQAHYRAALQHLHTYSRRQAG